MPSSLTSARSPAAKPRMSGTWAKTLFPATRSARPYSLGDLAAGVGAQELDLGPDALGPGRLGDVRGRLDAEHRDARRLEVLKQVAVVAGHLGDQAAGVRSSRSVIASA